jgi:hypothetical protein
MKYMLMMNAMTTGDVYAGVTGWQNKDIQAHTIFLKGLTQSLRESGELVSTEGLGLPDQARIVRAGKDGAPITDGLFPEAKEFLAGLMSIVQSKRTPSPPVHRRLPDPTDCPCTCPSKCGR